MKSYYIKTDGEDAGAVADLLALKQGIHLKAEAETDTVEGFVDAINYPPGTSGVCGLCGKPFTDGHSCARVTLYDADDEEPPNNVHRSTLKKSVKADQIGSLLKRIDHIKKLKEIK